MYVSSGVQVSWSSNAVTVTEGDNVSISLLLDREPGVDLIIAINTTNLNTTGCYYVLIITSCKQPLFCIGYDFAVSPYFVVFASDDIQKDVNISASFDKILEFNETFILYFEIASDAKAIGVVEGFPSVVNVTILNNDSQLLIPKVILLYMLL